MVSLEIMAPTTSLAIFQDTIFWLLLAKFKARFLGDPTQ